MNLCLLRRKLKSKKQTKPTGIRSKCTCWNHCKRWSVNGPLGPKGWCSRGALSFPFMNQIWCNQMGGHGLFLIRQYSITFRTHFYVGTICFGHVSCNSQLQAYPRVDIPVPRISHVGIGGLTYQFLNRLLTWKIQRRKKVRKKPSLFTRVIICSKTQKSFYNL